MFYQSGFPKKFKNIQISKEPFFHKCDSVACGL